KIIYLKYRDNIRVQFAALGTQFKLELMPSSVEPVQITSSSSSNRKMMRQTTKAIIIYKGREILLKAPNFATGYITEAGAFCGTIQYHNQIVYLERYFLNEQSAAHKNDSTVIAYLLEDIKYEPYLLADQAQSSCDNNNSVTVYQKHQQENVKQSLYPYEPVVCE